MISGNIVYYFQTDIDDLKRQNGILDQQGMASYIMYLIWWYSGLIVQDKCVYL